MFTMYRQAQKLAANSPINITRFILIQKRSGIKVVAFHLKKVSAPDSYFVEIEKFLNQHR